MRWLNDIHAGSSIVLISVGSAGKSDLRSLEWQRVTHTLYLRFRYVCQEQWYPTTKLHGVAAYYKTVILKDAMFYFSVYVCHYEHYDILSEYHCFLQNMVLL